MKTVFLVDDSATILLSMSAIYPRQVMQQKRLQTLKRV
jgi:hypothetical protein